MRMSKIIFKTMYIILFISSCYLVVFLIDFLSGVYSLPKFLFPDFLYNYYSMLMYAFYYSLLFNSILSLILFLMKKHQIFMVWAIVNFILFLIVSFLILFMVPDLDKLKTL
jgi:hypothetical protein